MMVAEHLPAAQLSPCRFIQRHCGATQGLLKDGQESSSKIYKLFSVNLYGKTAIELFVAMPSSSLYTNFQLLKQNTS